jgi:hypothetical protein
MRGSRRLGALLALGIVIGAPNAARADDPKPNAGSNDAAANATEAGRQAFLRGVGLAKAEQWSDALASFEEAAAARDAPLVQFNIAYCQRALGRYVAARETARKVVKSHDGLSQQQLDDAKAYLEEFERVIVQAHVTVEPGAAALTVDGRPLLQAGNVYLAGVSPPGEGKPLATSTAQTSIDVALDPGVHVFRAARAGHQDAILKYSWRAGAKVSVELKLDVLPATIAIRSEPGGGIVRIDKREVGLAPIDVERPAGKYKLEVVRDTFETYSIDLDLAPGQRADLTAKLVPYKEPLTKKWWFWAGATAVVAGGVVLTYALTRPTPEPPPYDGGNTNWVAKPQPAGFRF